MVGNISHSELMKIPKSQLAHKLMGCQVTINKAMASIERLLDVKPPVPVLDIVALTQDIEHVLINSPCANKAEAIAVMICRRSR